MRSSPPPGASEPQWARSPGALWRRTFDRTVLLDPSTGDTFNVSPSGAAVWELLEIPSTVSEIVQELAPSYGVGSQTLECDVRALLNGLHDRGIVTRA